LAHALNRLIDKAMAVTNTVFFMLLILVVQLDSVQKL